MVSLKTPAGSMQPYRRLTLQFDALTFNSNTVRRRALCSATSIGGSVFMLVTGCIANRYKEAAPGLAQVQGSFRAYATSKQRTAELEATAAARETAAMQDYEFGASDMALSEKLGGTVGFSSVGRVGYRYEK